MDNSLLVQLKVPFSQPFVFVLVSYRQYYMLIWCFPPPPEIHHRHRVGYFTIPEAEVSAGGRTDAFFGTCHQRTGVAVGLVRFWQKLGRKRTVRKPGQPITFSGNPTLAVGLHHHTESRSCSSVTLPDACRWMLGSHWPTRLSSVFFTSPVRETSKRPSLYESWVVDYWPCAYHTGMK